MTRIILLLTALVTAVSLCAQQPMSPNQPQGVPQNVISVNPSPTIVVAGSGLYGPSVFMAPSAGFAAPQAAAGATQSGFVSGAAGVSLNSAPYLGVTSTLGPAPLVYEGGQPGYAYTPGSVSAGVEAAAPPGRLINDMGPSSYGGTVAPGPNGEVVNLAPPPPPISLGEVAASFRATTQPHPLRVYVNPAGQQLEQTYVVTGAAIATNVIPETVVVGQNPPAGTATAQAQQPQPPQNQPPAPQAQNQPSAPQAQGQQPQNQPSAPQAQAPQQPANQPPAPSTMPPVPSAQQAEPNQQPSRLPATSTVLPLLGLLGLASSGLAIWLLKVKR
ncbi:MAG TPA: hypothetical protein VKE93_20020 [Candidatus Angelobacter sp.]|nr:hypothetical protein [Candidatus Angelobacter sp.]